MRRRRRLLLIEYGGGQLSWMSILVHVTEHKDYEGATSRELWPLPTINVCQGDIKRYAMIQ